MNFAALLDIPAMIAPEQLALIDTGDAGRRVSYGQLRERAGRAAALLAAQGIAPGDRVGVLATNSAECLEAIFGIALLGAVVVPMNFRAGAEELTHLLADAGVRVLFSETRYREAIEACRPASLERVLYLDRDYAGQRDAHAAIVEMAEVADEDLAVLPYTSGTTSLPKGVKITHGALTGYIMAGNDAADGTEGERTLLAAPLYHIAGFTSMLNALYSGRPLIVLPQFRAPQWLRAVQEHRANQGFLAPTMLAHVIADPGFSGTDLSSLRQVTYGAAPMPPPVIRRALALFPAGCGFSGAYGQTETTSTVAVLSPEDHRLEGSEQQIALKLARLGSVGRVLDDVQVRIVGEGGALLEPGEVGEVQLKTYRATSGYWGRREKTRVTIDADGWVHTGDLGYLDEDNYLFLTGRAGDMIIRGGENVSPEEVEAVLHEHPAVSDAAVVGLPDEEWGERVAAAVVLREPCDAALIMDHCRSRLAPFKRPAVIHLAAELPRTSTGKLLRRHLVPLLQELGY